MRLKIPSAKVFAPFCPGYSEIRALSSGPVRFPKRRAIDLPGAPQPVAVEVRPKSLILMCFCYTLSWWRHGVETHSLSLTLWVGNQAASNAVLLLPLSLYFIFWCFQQKQTFHKKLSCRWFVTPWRPCDATVMYWTSLTSATKVVGAMGALYSRYG